ncbi:hypothetical protein QE152_g37919 [Popillia japonica]|uniref:Uncharacterized protein n=1 Tax=Popillia japonica TaxID=7064 RepID=A0AAW1I9C5_POPJA
MKISNTSKVATIQIQDKEMKSVDRLKQINTQKTEIMKISNTSKVATIQIQDKEMKSVDRLNYLGTIIRLDGRIEEEISNRVNKTISTFGMLYKVTAKVVRRHGENEKEQNSQGDMGDGNK